MKSSLLELVKIHLELVLGLCQCAYSLNKVSFNSFRCDIWLLYIFTAEFNGENLYLHACSLNKVSCNSFHCDIWIQHIFTAEFCGENQYLYAFSLSEVSCDSFHGDIWLQYIFTAVLSGKNLASARTAQKGRR